MTFRDVARALQDLPRGAGILVQGSAGESLHLAQAVAALTPARPDLRFVGVFLPGVNRQTYGAGQGCSVTTFFLTAELKKSDATFVPIGYSDIAKFLMSMKLDAMLTTLAPPDGEGFCSFGVTADFLPDLWQTTPVRIAHINGAMPATLGVCGIHIDDLTVAFRLDAPLIEVAAGADSELQRTIAAHVASQMPDVATVQTGIGSLPSACMRALSTHRNLRIHSGYVGEWVLDLIDANALAPDAPVVTGIALGTSRLYRAAASPRFEFRPVSFTHDQGVLGALPNLVTINAALEVDLLGQVYSERGPEGFISGPGGALDFARGARRARGLRIIALPSQARGASRIVAPNAGRGPVSLCRFDVDIVATEYGAADLRECTHDVRAERLAGLAAPEHRPALSEAWRAFAR